MVFTATDGTVFTDRKLWRKHEFETQYTFRSKTGEKCVKLPGSIDGQNFDLSDLTDCEVQLLDYSDQVQVDVLKNCKVFVGASSESLFIRNCTGCTFVAACKQLRTRDCVDCTVFLHCKTEPIIELSTGMRFGAFNGAYNGHAKQIKSAGLDTTNLWFGIFDFNDEAKTGVNWSLIDQEESLRHIWRPLNDDAEICIPYTSPGTTELPVHTDQSVTRTANGETSKGIQAHSIADMRGGVSSAGSTAKQSPPVINTPLIPLEPPPPPPGPSNISLQSSLNLQNSVNLQNTVNLQSSANLQSSVKPLIPPLKLGFLTKPEPKSENLDEKDQQEILYNRGKGHEKNDLDSSEKMENQSEISEKIEDFEEESVREQSAENSYENSRNNSEKNLEFSENLPKSDEKTEEGQENGSENRQEFEDFQEEHIDILEKSTEIPYGTAENNFGKPLKISENLPKIEGKNTGKGGPIGGGYEHEAPRPLRIAVSLTPACVVVEYAKGEIMFHKRFFAPERGIEEGTLHDVERLSALLITLCPSLFDPSLIPTDQLQKAVSTLIQALIEKRSENKQDFDATIRTQTHSQSRVQHANPADDVNLQQSGSQHSDEDYDFPSTRAAGVNLQQRGSQHSNEDEDYDFSDTRAAGVNLQQGGVNLQQRGSQHSDEDEDKYFFDTLGEQRSIYVPGEEGQIEEFIDEEFSPLEDSTPPPPPPLPEDLNTVDDTTLHIAKSHMDVGFYANVIRPDEEGYVHDKRIDFGPPLESADWDESSGKEGSYEDSFEQEDETA